MAVFDHHLGLFLGLCPKLVANQSQGSTSEPMLIA